MPLRLHALAALVLCNFRFASFFERAHSVFLFSRVAIQPSNLGSCEVHLLVRARGVDVSLVRVEKSELFAPQSQLLLLLRRGNVRVSFHGRAQFLGRPAALSTERPSFLAPA